MGARGYIVKSSGLDELHKALMAIHEREYYSSELVASNFFQLLNSDKDDTLHKISEREIQFLKYCPTELTLKEIAQKMKVSTSTVQGYRNMLFDKLNLKTRQGLAIFAVRSGIVSFEDL
jgi:DNA-binding NarL/FixJ family response regulator